MPHYKDGTEAKVGDQVAGKLYNTPGVRAGTIISITPGVDSCNAMVGFLVAVTDEPAAGPLMMNQSAARLPVWDNDADVTRRAPRFRVTRPQSHGSAGEPYKLVECADYCAVNELTKLPE